MKKIIIALMLIILFISCSSEGERPADKVESPSADKSERPTDAQFHAYKAYHHARYMVTTAEQAGGTNKLINTRELPTEGTDPVVTPALDHLYSKAVIDLTSGPVYVEIPEVKDDRYWSIHITDQEHYTIFDEISPVGKYVFVRKGKDMEVLEGARVIECPEDYPHLFIRIQLKTDEDKPNVYAIQEKIKLTGVSKPLEIDNYIEFTLATHDVYEENKGILETVTDFDEEDYDRVTQYLFKVAPTFPNNLGMFGPIDSNEPNSNSPVHRAVAIFGHLGLPAAHAIYFPNFVDCDGNTLNGDNTEVFTFSSEPKGVKNFWSITRYSGITRNTLPGKNDVYNAYNTKPDADGNITITFSVEDPKDGTYWMPVNAGEPYYFVVRYYEADLNNLPKTHCD
ncbi:DUF1254 domain-containing protein [Acidobacteriota bacterium]